MDKESIGKIIYDTRKENGLTQEELGAILFVGREAVSKWERGVNAPDILSLLRFCRIFEISFAEIFKTDV